MPSGSPRGPQTVVITGAAGPLGRHVLELLVADDEVERIVALDDRALSVSLPRVEGHRLDVGQVDLKPLFEDASTVIHLTRWGGPLEPVSSARVGSSPPTRGICPAAVFHMRRCE